MMRSLFAGVSGLKNHQTKMDVIGNNIANVNTIGFKKSRVIFQDMLSQTLRGASSPTENKGGVNPMQVGLGMSIASIDVIHTSSSPQSTGKNTDLSIEGDGYFMLSDGANTYYSRAGNFDFDYNKSFYNTSNGMIVKGILADADGVIDPKGNVVDINLSSQTSSPPNATSAIQFSKNLNSTEAPLTGTVTQAHTTGAITTFTLAPESLPITKVEIDDPSDNPLTEGTDFTVNYTTGQVRILAANPDGDYTVTYHEPNYSIDVPIYDSKGESYTANIYYTKVADNTWEVDTAIADPSATDTLLTDGKGTLTFDPITGKMTSSTVTNATKTITGAANLNFTLDFSNVTEYAGESTAIYNSQDGYTAGYLQDVSVDTSGTITGSFSNGKSRKLAQVAIATFPNPSGLTKDGNNNFQVSYNSGEPDAGIPGISGRGTIKPETLEMSNVDLSQEFVDMIITQRGFQANSRVITTSDQILEELVNLRR